MYAYACVCAHTCLCNFITYVVSCDYHNQTMELFHHHSSHVQSQYSHTQPPHIPPSLNTDNHEAILFINVLFQECHINGMTQFITFWDWLFSLSIIPLNSIQVVCIKQFIPYYWWIYHGMNVQVCLQAKIFNFVKNTCFPLTKSYMKIKYLNKYEVASLKHEFG